MASSGRAARGRLRRASVRARVLVRRVMPPARRALALIVAGDALLIFGISLVAVPAAYIFAGASLVAYGLLFVDVDSSPRGRP